MRKNNKLNLSDLPNTYTFHFDNHVSVVVQKSAGLLRAGFAYTSPNDNFNRKLGRLIAMNRCFSNKIDAPHHLMFCAPIEFFDLVEQELYNNTYNASIARFVINVEDALTTMRKVLEKTNV